MIYVVGVYSGFGAFNMTRMKIRNWICNLSLELYVRSYEMQHIYKYQYRKNYQSVNNVDIF